MTKSHGQRVADTVRVEMARRRITQTMLAERMGLSQAAVGRRLTGVVPFDVDELGMVAEYLGVDVATLVGSDAA